VRREDWLDRLWATLKAAEGRPFQYGACVQLAAECVDAIISNSNFREEVVPLIEAAQERPLELAELQAHVTERLGEPIPINCGNQGDVVLLQLPGFPGAGNGPALGICTGHLVACAGYPSGVAYLNLNKAKAIWRVA
jgi:hypothetical protein